MYYRKDVLPVCGSPRRYLGYPLKSLNLLFLHRNQQGIVFTLLHAGVVSQNIWGPLSVANNFSHLGYPSSISFRPNAFCMKLGHPFPVLLLYEHVAGNIRNYFSHHFRQRPSLCTSSIRVEGSVTEPFLQRVQVALGHAMSGHEGVDFAIPCFQSRPRQSSTMDMSLAVHLSVFSLSYRFIVLAVLFAALLSSFVFLHANFILSRAGWLIGMVLAMTRMATSDTQIFYPLHSTLMFETARQGRLRTVLLNWWPMSEVSSAILKLIAILKIEGNFQSLKTGKHMFV